MSDPHRPEIPEVETEPTPKPSSQVPVGDAGVGRPRAALGDPSAEHEVGLAGQHGFGDPVEVGQVERTVGVGERDHVGSGGLEAGPAGRAEATHGLVDDLRTEPRGDGPGAVGAGVVDDDRRPSIRDRREHSRQRAGLVQDGQDDLVHDEPRYWWRGDAVAWVGTGAALALVTSWGSHLLRASALIGAPPFFGNWRFTLRPAVLLPVVVAAAVVFVLPHVSQPSRVRWAHLVALVALAAMAWSASLAMAGGGTRQFTAEFHTSVDYVGGIHTIGSHPGAYLSTYATKIRGPAGAVPSKRGYPIHVQGHPPGGVLTVWAGTKLGLSPVAASVVLMVVGQALVAASVVFVAREVAGERAARRVAPFVVLLPAALWSHSLDTWFAGLGAVAVASTVAAIVRVDDHGHPRRWLVPAFIGGIAFGAVGLSSYGLVLLALLPVAVAVQRRRFGPLVLAGAVGGVVVAAPALWGFWVLDGLSATTHQYRVTVAMHRPYVYFLVANMVIAAVAVGPAVVAATAKSARHARAAPTTAAAIVLGALGALVLADLSGMAKGEVERIWQPFFPWLVLAVLALPQRQRRDRSDEFRLAGQAAVGIGLAVSLWTLW